MSRLWTLSAKLVPVLIAMGGAVGFQAALRAESAPAMRQSVPPWQIGPAPEHAQDVDLVSEKPAAPSETANADSEQVRMTEVPASGIDTFKPFVTVIVTAQPLDTAFANIVTSREFAAVSRPSPAAALSVAGLLSQAVKATEIDDIPQPEVGMTGEAREPKRIDVAESAISDPAEAQDVTLTARKTADTPSHDAIDIATEPATLPADTAAIAPVTDSNAAVTAELQSEPAKEVAAADAGDLSVEASAPSTEMAATEVVAELAPALDSRDVAQVSPGQAASAGSSIQAEDAKPVLVVAEAAENKPQPAMQVIDSKTPIDPAQIIDEGFIKDIRSWIANPIVAVTLKAQNARRAGFSEEKIKELDEQWTREREAEQQPLIAATLSGPLSVYLIRIQANSQGAYSEIIAMDGRGLNAGQSKTTTDYWQGDEDKFKKTYGVGPDAIFIDEPFFDEKTNAWRVQLNMTVTDPDTKEKIGAMTIEVNLTEMQRRKMSS